MHARSLRLATLHALVFVVFVAVVASPALHAARQAPGAEDPAAAAVALARSGKTAEAWTAWASLPDGPDKQRTGIDIAAAAGEPQRALELYDALTGEGANPDGPALRSLALAAATRLATTPDVEARAAGCGAALVLDPNHEPCRKALESMASSSSNAYLQGLAAYSMANAGVRPFPGLFTTLEQELAPGMRMAFADMMTRLPSEDRLSLVRTILNDRDPANRYQAVLVLANVPGDNVTAALRNVEPGGPVRTALTVALARHGDKASLEALGDLLPSLSPFETISAARALLDGIDIRGLRMLEEMLRSPNDLTRVHAAEAMARVNPDASYRVLVDTLESGSVAIRAATLRAAGAVRMGTDRTVYRYLVDDSAETRAAAIRTIADTLVAHPAAPPQ